MKVNHTGFVVKNLDAAIEGLEALGFHVTVEPFEVSYGHVMKAMMENEYGEGAELISPINEESDMYPVLLQRAGAEHICMETPDFDKTIEELCQHGYTMNVVRFAKGFGSRACFLSHPEFGKVQIVETIKE